MLTGTGGVWEEQDQGFVTSLKGQLGISLWPSVARSSDFFFKRSQTSRFTNEISQLLKVGN